MHDLSMRILAYRIMKIPTIIGHRGAPEAALENTESSFRAALDAGAEIIETDVRLSMDGHIVISHDANFSRLGGPSKAIAHMTRSEIGKIRLAHGNFTASPPLFMDEALKIFPETQFNVDLKDHGKAIVEAWSHLLNATAMTGRCRTASFYDSVLRRFSRLNPKQLISVARFGIICFLITNALGIPRKPKENEGVLQIPEIYGPIRIITHKRIESWHRLGWQVHVWTVDEKNDMIRLAEWGVDAIITNRPALAREIFKQI